MAVTIEHSNKNFFKELKSILEFFNASPDILTKEGFVSDTFLLMENFLQAEPDNVTAQIMFDSVNQLYATLGQNANLYFKVAQLMAPVLMSGETDVNVLRAELQKRLNSTQIQTFIFDDYDSFIEKGFSKQVLEAIEKADGSFLKVEQADGPVDYITQEKGFSFHIEHHSPFKMEKAKVLILEKNYPLEVIMNLSKLCGQEPLLVVCMGHSDAIEKFAGLNESPNLRIIFARPEYLNQDFEADIKRYVNQSVVLRGADIRPDSAGQILSASVSGETARIYSEPSYIQKKYLKTLLMREAAEQSPLIQQQIQARIHNLSGDATILNVCAPTNIELQSKLQKYMTEVLEISYIIKEGMVTSNTFDSSFNGISARCFVTLLPLVVSDLGLAMSTTRIIQK